MRSKQLLDSFVRYCQEHPDERFWQALRNWSRAPFIFVAEDNAHGRAVDTFYSEKQNPLE